MEDTLSWTISVLPLGIFRAAAGSILKRIIAPILKIKDSHGKYNMT